MVMLEKIIQQPLVLNKEDSTPGEWIESGPHLMLIPKDASEVANFTDDFMHGEPYVMMRDTDYAHYHDPHRRLLQIHKIINFN